MKRFTNFNDNSNDGWADLVADLEKRYGDTAQPYIPHESVQETLASHSTIVAVVDDVIRSPSSNDSPLWRVRCRVCFHGFSDFCLTSFTDRIGRRYSVPLISDSPSISWITSGIYARNDTWLGLPRGGHE